MHARLARPLVAASLALSLIGGFAPLASAADGASLVPSNPCIGKTGIGRDRCISDAVKLWSKALLDLRTQQQKERNAWKTEHVYLGESAEYRAQLAAFIKQQQEEMKAFKEGVSKLQRELDEQRKAIRSQTKGEAKGYNRAVTKQEVKDATAACTKEKDEKRRRICIRRALQLQGPAKAWIQR